MVNDSDISSAVSIVGKLSIESRKKLYLQLKAEFEPSKQRGTKIRDAYDAISYEPQDMAGLLKKFGVSPNVMRHHKRFDPFQERGHVKSKEVAGVRLIWRVKPE